MIVSIILLTLFGWAIVGHGALIELGGVKANTATIGVTAAVELNDCEEMIKKENHVISIAKWSQDAGKRTGIVTTSRITDASPSGTYAHTANRRWQDDTSVKEAGQNSTKCRDIAYQLIKEKIGKDFNVILGGGSGMFLPNGTRDDLGSEGSRSDDIHLINEWVNDKKAENKNAQYIWNRTELLNVSNNTDYILGLFSEGYMPFNLDRNVSLTPSLEEMTEAAIKIVSKGNGEEDGYFLFIEGGRIDQAHHLALAHKALDETVEFSKAIQKAVELTNEEDTLIVVTSDHAHTLSMSGYPDRYNDIFGTVGDDVDGNMILTLNYANGPGYKAPGHNLRDDDTGNHHNCIFSGDKDYQFPGIYNLTAETHGADDVGIFAKGPWSHLFSGVMEQNVIPHIMAYASCVGSGLTACCKGPE
ncbi:hypothetical protein NQ314_006674 [Rhamnusium bicolor]|uniref:alkaline phosphatase n=1 Tax=Rhamnusium bicolor TaxID=1586634 RepID=A0AAV8Z0M0_9CUCU|nr:hypothetical protein NQ314_006674 [Rhamnusium bicolor]